MEGKGTPKKEQNQFCHSPSAQEGRERWERPHGFGGRDSPPGLEAHVSEDLRRDADARRRRGGEEMGRTAAWMLPHGGKQCHAICDFFGYGSVFASASTSFLTRVCFGMYGGVYEWFERQEFWILCAVHSCRLFFLGAPHQTV